MTGEAERSGSAPRSAERSDEAPVQTPEPVVGQPPDGGGQASSAPLEDELRRLEEIVQKLEREEVPLEQALALFEEGIGIARSARGKLEAAEGRVREILREAGETFRLRDLDL